MKYLATAILVLSLAVPSTAMAQEDDAEDREATILSISSYQCPNSAIAGIASNYDSLTRPVEEELVAEGKMASAGLFFHAWADEWNVNYYRTGYDIGSLVDAIAEVGTRVREANPDLGDGPGPFAACTAHKDNIYFFGPRTGDNDDDAGGN
ncbi:MAG: hypothetical protein BMS9Abin29_2605 [Gemmatimonadota bacterium]|nr:MAG: hypothetical protein BMS9Abin29_2605 [Gemmatimonadota bacterium]